MSLLGTGSTHLQGRYAKRPAPGRAAASNVVCQRCLQKGHWTYECKNTATYASRPTRTQQLLNPKVRQRFLDPSEVPDDVKPAPVTVAPPGRKRKAASSSDSSSSDSDSDSSSSSGTSQSGSSSSSSSGSDTSSSNSGAGSSSSSGSSSSDSGSSSDSDSDSSVTSSDSSGTSGRSSEPQDNRKRAKDKARSVVGSGSPRSGMDRGRGRAGVEGKAAKDHHDRSLWGTSRDNHTEGAKQPRTRSRSRSPPPRLDSPHKDSQRSHAPGPPARPEPKIRSVVLRVGEDGRRRYAGDLDEAVDEQRGFDRPAAHDGHEDD